MSRTNQWRLAGVVLASLLSIYALWPSWQYYSMTPAQRAALLPEELAKLRRKAIPLGLDLQGGMHLVLEVDKSRLSAEEAQDAVERVKEVLDRRVDAFGVAEPLIQRQGQDRIVIQLPGLTDRERAMELIGKTALLEFQLVRTDEEGRNVWNRLDAWLAARGAATAELDTSMRRAPLTSLFLEVGNPSFVRNDDVPAVQRLLATAGLDSVVPFDSEVLWSAPEQASRGVTGRSLYVLKKEPEMTGGSIASAQAQVGLSQADPGAWGVTMTMTPRGRADFARITGNSVGRYLAIVLDSEVASAPVIRERIPGGNASITGNFGVEESKDLAIVLRAGALPAPVQMVEERTVGPSLGADSIRQGLTAGVIGSILVVVFMVVYYQLSGAIAIAALVLNVFYVLATLGAFSATLTLPGIAGLVLSVGMAVDANVLIFERIREELRTGRSVRQSVDLGYTRAFRTIFDSNLTVILCCLFLFQFGTGPIKGFAVTMIIGLVANVFTAVLFTRMIYDFMLGRGKVERLSI